MNVSGKTKEITVTRENNHCLGWVNINGLRTPIFVFRELLGVYAAKPFALVLCHN
jgi:hypothetical protein